jgi:RNA polymerase sigma factor (sigma-70 family)
MCAQTKREDDKSPKKDFEVTIRIRNNQLKSRRLELGLSTVELAKRIGISYPTYLDYEGLKTFPLLTKDSTQGKAGDFKKSALKIAEFFGISPYELFPEITQRILKTTVTGFFNVEELQLSTGTIMELPPTPEELVDQKELRSNLESVLKTLTPREEEFIRSSYGLGCDPKKDSELAEEYGLSRGRVGQILANAIRKLRHPAKSGSLEPYKESLDIHPVKFCRAKDIAAKLAPLVGATPPFCPNFLGTLVYEMSKGLSPEELIQKYLPLPATPDQKKHIKWELEGDARSYKERREEWDRKKQEREEVDRKIRAEKDSERRRLQQEQEEARRKKIDEEERAKERRRAKLMAMAARIRKDLLDEWRGYARRHQGREPPKCESSYLEEMDLVVLAKIVLRFRKMYGGSHEHEAADTATFLEYASKVP